MEAKPDFNVDQFNSRTCRLILVKAEEWQCPPSKAVERLLDQAADAHIIKDLPKVAVKKVALTK